MAQVGGVIAGFPRRLGGAGATIAVVRAYVGVTDYNWYRFLADRPGVAEVNFWQPSGAREFKVLAPGELRAAVSNVADKPREDSARRVVAGCLVTLVRGAGLNLVPVGVEKTTTRHPTAWHAVISAGTPSGAGAPLITRCSTRPGARSSVPLSTGPDPSGCVGSSRISTLGMEAPAHEEMVVCGGGLDEDLVHDIGAGGNHRAELVTVNDLGRPRHRPGRPRLGQLVHARRTSCAVRSRSGT
jgi:hypothetical protein